MAKEWLPVARTLTPETIATRKAGLLPGLALQASKTEPLTDGLRLEFAADLLPQIAATIDGDVFDRMVTCGITPRHRFPARTTPGNARRAGRRGRRPG